MGMESNVICYTLRYMAGNAMNEGGAFPCRDSLCILLTKPRIIIGY